MKVKSRAVQIAGIHIARDERIFSQPDFGTSEATCPA
jgi:hypothetical protein